VLIEYQPPITVDVLRRLLDSAVAGRFARRGTRPRAAQALSAAAVQGGDGLNRHDPCHAIPIDEVATRLAADRVGGLLHDEASRRLALYGRNDLRRAEPRALTAIVIEQLASLPIALLGASAALSLATGGIADAVMIGAVVLLNTGIAGATERQAEHTILGLANFSPQPVPMMRDGRRQWVHPGELVPGDLVLLERGILVPADARLISSDDLTVNEAALTGEALPVHKDAGVLLPPETVFPIAATWCSAERP
jgi:Ca2+-transporting ATPase